MNIIAWIQRRRAEIAQAAEPLPSRSADGSQADRSESAERERVPHRQDQAEFIDLPEQAADHVEYDSHPAGS